MEENMKVWDKLKQPPSWALHEIKGGRLKGKTDISPQWRYQVMTEQFGMCGVGWNYEVVRVWNEPLQDGQVLAFAEILLHVGDNASIPGIGGSMLVEKEKEGLHANDEGYKMAITDALSVAMKMLGVGANIYAGLSGSKYQQPVKETPKEKPAKVDPNIQKLKDYTKALGWKQEDFDKHLKAIYHKERFNQLSPEEAGILIAELSAMVDMKYAGKEE